MEKIEGIPDGWRLVRIGSAKEDEYWMDEDGSIKLCLTDHIRGLFCPIVERVKSPEPTYRPFANAAEFEPHRDKWIYYSRFSDKKFRVLVYDDNMVWLYKESFEYSTLFASGTVFEDGTRFGVKVTEE